MLLFIHMRRLILPGILIAACLILPQSASAQFGLLACGGVECQACHLVDTANNVIRFLISILASIGVLLFVFGGFLFLTARGDTSQVDKAKGILIDVVIGFVIVLAAWLIVDTVMKNLLPSGQVQFGTGDLGPWNEIRCVAQPEYEARGRTPAAGSVNGELLTDADVARIVGAFKSDTEVQAMVEAAAAEAGITDPDRVKLFRALIMKESSNCRNVKGPDTGKGRGSAYGCGQILVGTAVGIDKKLENRYAGLDPKNPSDARKIAEDMLSDQSYNIRMSAEYLNDGFKKYSKDEYAVARYNGGDQAMNPSNTCKGETWYECDKNPGFAQTREYVPWIFNVAKGLDDGRELFGPS